MSRGPRAAALALLVACLAGCARRSPVDEVFTGSVPPPRPGPEAISLLGRPLYAPAIPPDRRRTLEGDLARALEDLRRRPQAEDGFIWVGRRLAYLGRYREAVEAFTRGLAIHPASFRLLRHRGHRWITLRRFDHAIEDLERAADLARGVPDEVEPDGAPNRFNIPRSTTHSNIDYHLGLAHYLEGDFVAAAAAWRAGMEHARVNDDMLCATAYWLHLALRRLGAEAEAREVRMLVHPRMEILENEAYLRLLLLEQGIGSAEEILAGYPDDGLEFATRAYGIAGGALASGDTGGARHLLERIVRGSAWAAFGHIAAEADLARLRAAGGKD